MGKLAREDMKHAAFSVGQQLGQGAGDFYDVVGEVVAGYLSGIGAVPGTDHHVKMALAALNELASVSGNVLAGSVQDAREHGASWSLIGDGLEVSRQAAQQKYGKG